MHIFIYMDACSTYFWRHTSQIIVKLLLLNSWWKIAQIRLLIWPIQSSWFEDDFLWWGYETCGPHVECLLRTSIYTIGIFSMTCRTCHLIIDILCQCNFDFESLSVIFVDWPLGGFYTLYIMTLCFYCIYFEMLLYH